jgi:hypothetical protein
MFPEINQAADEIDAALEVNEQEAELLRETAANYASLPGGYGVSVALLGIVREVGLHAEALRTQLRALRTACGQASGEGSAAHH